MSYARMLGDSDVYVFPHVAGGIQCYCADGGLRANPEEIIAHLEERIAAGDRVPDDVIPRIREDIKAGYFTEPVEPQVDTVEDQEEANEKFTAWLQSLKDKTNDTGEAWKDGAWQ